MDCFHQTLVQVPICFFMTNDNHNLVIFYQISSKFHVSIVSIKLVLKFEYKFSPTNDNKDGLQNGRRLSICFCGQSTLIIYYRVTSKLHIWITFIKVANHGSDQLGLGKFDNIRGYPSILGSQYTLLYFIL